MTALYTPYFGLREDPFGMAPDPHFLFLSPLHQEGLAHLLYGVTQPGGFIELSGPVGTGKTTLVRRLLEQPPADFEIALIINPKQTPKAFIRNLLQEIQPQTSPASHRADLPTLINLINDRLLEIYRQGRRVILVVDEAQALPVETLEQIRLLTNLETRTTKLMQIILVGQPELDSLLDRPDLLPLRNRITARFRLGPLRAAETQAYIHHRLKVAGLATPLFTTPAMRSIHRSSHGLPRTINILCDRALLGAYVQRRRLVTLPLARQAAHEVAGASRPASRLRRAFHRANFFMFFWILGGCGICLHLGNPVSRVYPPSGYAQPGLGLSHDSPNPAQAGS
ncbi:general secretion pathway protein A [mine drainage metagenome]|uniref:General secretion pathway protein A n=1 Tax=mine drainage metagenome TaxID=410659 RepID=T0YF80_9ZZZZ